MKQQLDTMLGEWAYPSALCRRPPVMAKMVNRELRIKAPAARQITHIIFNRPKRGSIYRLSFKPEPLIFSIDVLQGCELQMSRLYEINRLRVIERVGVWVCRRNVQLARCHQWLTLVMAVGEADIGRVIPKLVEDIVRSAVPQPWH